MYDITVDRISKTYLKSGEKALTDIEFQVEQGELFGVIGPDGAGKTTLFRILTTLLLPDSGNATVNGSDVIKDYKAIRRKVGYMPGKFSLYQDLTVEENIKFFATIFDTTLQANYDLIRDIYVQIEPFKDRRAGALSGGMKQKLALCCALVHRPKVLFLDEPTTGVDTVSRKEFWNMLKLLKNEGITILVSTPYMDEANLCEKIALIQDGKIMSINTPSGIIRNYPDMLYAIKADNMINLLHDLREIDDVKSVHSFGDTHHITLNNENIDIEKLKTQLQYENIQVEKITASVEDCFINLMSN